MNFAGILSNSIHMATVSPQSSFDPLKLWIVSNFFILPQRKGNTPQLLLLTRKFFMLKQDWFQRCCLLLFQTSPILSPHLASNLLVFFYGYTQSFVFTDIPALSPFEGSLLCRAGGKSYLVFLFILSTVFSHDCWSPLLSLLKWPLSESSRVWESCLKLSPQFL